MRAGLSSWLGLGFVGLGAFAACLPEVTVDDTLGNAGTSGVQDVGVGTLQGGAGGAAGSTSAPPGGGGAGTPAAAGAGGTASGGAPATDETGGSSSGGGSGTSGTGGTSGAGGIAGAAGAPAANAGEDVCPSNVTPEQACDNYCALYTEACGNFPTYDYAGATDCSTICQSSGWPIGTIAQPNSVLCRCNHSYKAKVFQQDPHCFHAARVPQKTGGCEIPPAP